MRRAGPGLLLATVVAGVVFGVAAADARVGGTARSAAIRPLLGITGNGPRFRSQTGQDSNVLQAFLAWGQGVSFGAPLAVLLPRLGPVPMIHLGSTKPLGTAEAITPGAIAAGQGDSYLIALNQAIAQFGRALYIRPLAEMNNGSNPWSAFGPDGQPRDPAHSTASFRKAFARIFVILHGGTAATVNAKLRRLGLPPVAGDLAVNPFPRVRIIWGPLAGTRLRGAGNAPEQYYPGDGFVDVVGGDIFDENFTAPWAGLAALHGFALRHRKAFAVPEWGLFSVDDAGFVRTMCDFLRTHSTEVVAFYESKPRSIFDLASKPKAASAYRACLAPLDGPLPAWAAGVPGVRAVGLSLRPSPGSGAGPLAVTFSITARLTAPVAHWQLVFGDGTERSGGGPPPASVPHTYAREGVYEATLAVYQSPPFAPAAARFITSTHVTVGDGANPLLSIDPTPATGRAPLSVSFRIEVAIPRTVTSWQLVLGDGIVRQGTGRPPRFAGHTYSQPGSYRVTLIVSEASTGAPARFIALAAVTVVGGAAAPPPPTGTPSGRVLVSGRPYTGGPIRYGSRVDVTNGALVIRADVGTLRVSGNGVSAVFVLVRTSENRRPFIELRLVGGDFSVCRTRKRSASHGARATPPPRTVRRLFSKGKGRFRTRGRYSSSSVRGTAWLTADRCDGTFTSVSQGRVLVVDLVRRRRVLVTAGKSYLTRRP